MGNALLLSHSDPSKPHSGVSGGGFPTPRSGQTMSAVTSRPKEFVRPRYLATGTISPASLMGSEEEEEERGREAYRRIQSGMNL